MFHLPHIATIFLCFTASRALRSVPQYAQDFSEHCKRRDALPSVFLSRRVMAADAQVLHFSKLEVPYSCFASVRTEPGHSIIMVVEMLPGNAQQCNEGYQLGIFEFPETFGGYWGPIPDAVLKQGPNDPVYTKQYTLARKELDTPSTTKPTVGITSTTTTTSRATVSTQDYITVDVPLVNLSANLEPIETPTQKPFDIDEYFDQFYDVLPRPGQPYKTSILPLVQIAVKEQEGPRKVDGERRYELDYAVGPFTPDHRLTTHARRMNVNRKIKLWKNKKLQDKRVEPKRNNSRKLKQYPLPTTTYKPLYEHIPPQEITEKYMKVEEKEPFNLIDNVMKSLNESGDLKIKDEVTDSGLEIFDKKEESYRNLSVYLAPFPTYAFLPVSHSPVNLINNITEIPLRGTTESIRTANVRDVKENETKNHMANNRNKKKQAVEHHNVTFKVQSEVQSVTKEVIKMPPKSMDSVKYLPFATGAEPMSSPSTKTRSTANVETIFNLALLENQEMRRPSVETLHSITDDGQFPVITTERSLSGTLVDHESWENVVQSAPVMAGLLHQQGPEPIKSFLKPGDDIARRNKRRLRRRRHISAIMVDDARPYHRPTTTIPVIQPSVFDAIDVHEFGRLIELPDDQMNNHVTLKLNPDTNTQLFDMCQEYNGTKTRFLHLFNSSRILLSISNFTTQHVMVTLTTARPLAMLEQQCPQHLVECQVEGTRVCIYGTNACDGIPNCGSAYAYDEDRVLCGVIDQQRSVYLAAATCLAVLVTTLYITHYWLRRCVPSVAEAFFVYYDSADNELYLDSIMRSPMDVDGDQYMYNSALFDEENLLDARGTRKSLNIFRRMLSSVIPKISFFKQQESLSKLLEGHAVSTSVSRDVRRNISYTDSELRSIMSTGKDQEVQTGESLEMAYLKLMNTLKEDESNKRPSKQCQDSVPKIVLREFLKTQISSSLDTSSPGPSIGRTGFVAQADLQEKEIHSTLYDPGPSNLAISEKMKSPGEGRKRGKKCLRFNEQATFIPRDDGEGDDPKEIEELSTGKHQHTRKKNDDNNSEHANSDFRKFFRKKKDHK